MADFGYDITDHTDVDPLFGTLDDVGRLLVAAHARGLRVLLDFVPGQHVRAAPVVRRGALVP